MKKPQKIKAKDLRVCDLVVINETPEATVRTVVCVRGHDVYLTWFEGTRLCGQWIDVRYLHSPTIEQVRNHVTLCGRLVTGHDIKDLQPA